MASTATDDLDQLFASLRLLDEHSSPRHKVPVPRHDTVNYQEQLKSKYASQSNVLSWPLLDLLQDVPQAAANGSKANAHGSGDVYDYEDFVQLPEHISRMSYRFKRKGLRGEIASYKEEVDLVEVANANAANSLLLTRKVDHRANAIKGSTSQLPFTPGGISMTTMKLQSNISETGVATSRLHRDADGLFDIPQGFDRGIMLVDNPEEGAEQVVDLHSLDQVDTELANKQELEGIKKHKEQELAVGGTGSMLWKPAAGAERNLADVDDLLPVGIEFGRTIHDRNKVPLKHEWAHVVNLSHTLENLDELVPNPARTWPFELDIFQKQAIYHLEQGDSVFVAAHTSAGKTVVAEYAIAMSTRNMTKTIYTSPIKALSNQKFRDFKEDFDDVSVGLITGDVQINADANCLIMTTEILRSMLYKGADLIRDVEFVIFDEVHYVNDQDRGVVWEEVIIMLPSHVKFILLSATVPNTFEFADWIGRTKHKNIYVLSTPKRPVPLEINVWAKDTMIPVINENREFLAKNFSKHADLLANSGSSNTAKKTASTRGNKAPTRGDKANKVITKGSRGVGAKGSNRSSFFKRDGPNKQTWPRLVNYLRSRDLLPVVIFVFSKKRCEDYAGFLEGTDFSTAKERSQVYMFIEKSIARLKKEDRDVPQIQQVRSLLERGIAIHHGGLLPIIKELIEMLFAKGFVKVLFATETFAMGLNLPTRTVVFSEIEKHDGNGLRYLSPGEFTQMAGRAGRRGKDKVGTVIVMSYNHPLDVTSFKDVTLGVPTRLKSQFRLTYNMILNLLRIEALRVEEMIKYSFGENTKQNLLPEQELKVKALREKLNESPDVNCMHCSQILDKAVELTTRHRDSIRGIITEANSRNILFGLLRQGRLIVYRDSDNNAKLGFVFRNDASSNRCVVVSFTKPCCLSDGKPNNLPYLTICRRFVKKAFQPLKLAPATMESVPFENIELISRYHLNVSLADLLNGDQKAKDAFQEKIQTVLHIAPKLKPADMDKHITLKIQQHLSDHATVVKEFMELDACKCPKFAEHFAVRYSKYKIEQEIADVVHLMSEQNLTLLPDYEQRLAVLKECGFIDSSNNVLLKGRIACEINSGFELALTELILDNFLGDFEPEEIVALLSAFVYEGRTKEEMPVVITPRLAKGKERIEQIYSQLMSTYETYQVPLTKDEAEFLEKKRFAIMNVVYEWARGLSFKAIMQISPEAEGTIVRVINRLDEVCRELKTAAVIIGDSNLHMKMTQAQELIKRDIVFAASLYL